MAITIFGTGAMACLMGARLAGAGEVTLVGAWPEGLRALRAGGIRVEGEGPNPPVRVAAVAQGEAAAPARLALVLVKAWQTARVAADLARYLAPDGLALTLQNGLGNLEQLGPRARLGVTTQGATLLGPGRVRPGGEGVTHVAAPEWVAEILRQAGFETHTVPPDEASGRLWGKLVVNCGINALTALLRAPNGELLRRPEAAQLMAQAAEECAAVARAKGIRLPAGDPAGQARRVAERTAINRSSMFQDILRGAPTEIDAINGAVAREAARLGVPAPVNTILWQLVRALAASPN
ncbi:MAG: ketopantoate reductase family protein [Anaerolineales bacterium]|nr:ketopantoate reductase family protein [Anaerolineales bacterium]